MPSDIVRAELFALGMAPRASRIWHKEQGETAKNSEPLSLFFVPENPRKSRISAKNGMPLADNSLPKQRKQRELRAPMSAGRRTAHNALLRIPQLGHP
jgi:hypothetical protein